MHFLNFIRQCKVLEFQRNSNDYMHIAQWSKIKNLIWKLYGYRNIYFDQLAVSNNKKLKKTQEMDTFSPLIKAWKQKGMTKTHKRWKKNLKVALHLVHSNSFCTKKCLHVCKLDHKAKLLLLKLIHLFAREVLLVKKLEIKETKTT